MAISIGKHVYIYIYVYLLASDRTESIGKHAYIYIYTYINIGKWGWWLTDGFRGARFSDKPVSLEWLPQDKSLKVAMQKVEALVVDATRSAVKASLGAVEKALQEQLKLKAARFTGRNLEILELEHSSRFWYGSNIWSQHLNISKAIQDFRAPLSPQWKGRWLAVSSSQADVLNTGAFCEPYSPMHPMHHILGKMIAHHS